jgi:LuxR family maltose regulon positive regulatory protein
MLPDGGASWLPRLDAVPELYPPSVTVVDLTARERAILHHLAEGMTRSQLAATLFISANTVKFHARGLYRKLHATNRQEAVSRARALGLLDDPGTGD